MEAIAGFLGYIFGCVAISIIFFCIFARKEGKKKSDEQRYIDYLERENKFRSDFEKDFIE